MTSFLSLLERYQDTQPSVEEVKRHYNVRAVAKGKVAVVQQDLSVHIEIVDTRDQSVIFANQYRIEGLDGLLDLQKTIARDITDHLKERLAGESIEPVFTRHTPDSAAHHNYLRGRHFWYKRTPGDLERALEYFKKAIDIDPDYALAWSGLGDTYRVMPKYAGTPSYRAFPLGREAAEKALRLDPMSPPIAGNLALMYHDLGELERSREILDEAIALNPENSAPYVQHAWLHSTQGDHEKAEEMAEKALSLNPTSLYTIQNVAYVHTRAQNFDRAIEILEEAMVQEPAFQRVANSYLGDIYSRMKQFDKAIEHHQKAIDIDPLDYDSYDQLAWTYWTLKEWEEAAHAWRKVMELKPDDARAYQYLGCVLGILGRIEEEWECYQKATELTPVQSIELGVWFLNYGDYERAVTGLIQAENVNPGYPNTMMYLFAAQFLSGDYPGAERSLSEWLKRLNYKGREILRAQALPGRPVDRGSLIDYIRLILERFEEEERPISGSFEARFPATLYILSGDLESAIGTLEYGYEHFETDSNWFPWYIRFSYFKPLHDDPRFWELVKKMKLAPYFNRDNLPYIK